MVQSFFLHLISQFHKTLYRKGARKVVKNHGMPFYGDSMSHGNLIISFKVEFPKRGTITDNQLQILSEVHIPIFYKN